MRAMRIQIARRLFPRSRRIFVWHRQHPLDEIGNGPGIPGLLYRRDGANAACGVVASHWPGWRRDRTVRRGRVRRTARANFPLSFSMCFFPTPR
jgi:hypothetical protein